MEIFVYRKGSPRIEEEFAPEKLPELLADDENLVWINMEAPTENENKILGDVFRFHPLLINDRIFQFFSGFDLA